MSSFFFLFPLRPSSLLFLHPTATPLTPPALRPSVDESARKARNGRAWLSWWKSISCSVHWFRYWDNVCSWYSTCFYFVYHLLPILCIMRKNLPLVLYSPLKNIDICSNSLRHDAVYVGCSGWRYYRRISIICDIRMILLGTSWRCVVVFLTVLFGCRSAQGIFNIHMVYNRCLLYGMPYQFPSRYPQHNSFIHRQFPAYLTFYTSCSRQSSSIRFSSQILDM